LLVSEIFPERLLVRRPQIGRKVRGFVVLLKEMFNDVKVFLTLYQVMSSMGQTMEISYPPIIAAFIDFVRQFASLDLFALPGLGCLDLSSRYIFKFWCRIFSTVSHLSLILSHFSHIYLTFLTPFSHLSHISSASLSGSLSRPFVHRPDGLFVQRRYSFSIF
jgi:hypothetical protein